MAASISPSSSSSSLLPPPSTELPYFLSQMSAVEMNRLRLSYIVQRLQTLLLASASSDSQQDFNQPCISLARSIDYAISNDDVPPIAPYLPSLVKQMYYYRDETSLQSATFMLMISVKNACTNGWFHNGDSHELLRMTNELLDSFCTGSMSSIAEASNVLSTISKIISRFYPQLSLGDLLVSFQVKPGYDVLVSDFNINKAKAPGESIRLFVAQTDDLETSSCLISPSGVSFLVNGKAVPGRANIYMNSGPQFPTDITRMLKRGTNIIQAAGSFNGNYIIAVVFMSKVSATNHSLNDYVQPTTQALNQDSEIIVGPSRISLNCPISFMRIKTPVKGHLCRHHQCFDYDNFMEMNSRKPTWRCPLCDQSASFLDLRIDQDMVKILLDIEVDKTDVTISADGSWKVFGEDGGENIKKLDCEVGDEFSIPNVVDDVVDLTMDEDGNYNSISEIEDIKPVITQGGTTLLGSDRCPRSWSSPSVPIESSVPNTVPTTNRCGTLESLVPTSVISPLIVDRIYSAPSEEFTANPSVNQHDPALQIAEGMHIQLPWSGIFNTREILPGQVCGVPVANQAFPAMSEAASSSQWSPLQLPSSLSGNLPSVSYQTIRTAQPQPRQVSRVPVANLAFPAMSEAASSSQWSPMQLPSSLSGNLPSVSHQTITSAQPQPGQVSRVPVANQAFSAMSEAAGSSQWSPVQVPSSLSFNLPSVSYQTIPSAQPQPSFSSELTQLHPSMQQVSGYGIPSQPLSYLQTSPSRLLNVGGYQILSHCTNTALSSYSPPENSYGTAGRDSQYSQLMDAARIASSRSVRPTFTSGSLLSTFSGNQQYMGGVEQSQSFASRSAAVPGAEGLPVLPVEHNWQPTGRMRGSLTGNAYSTALNHYLAHPSAQVRPTAGAAFTTGQPLMSNANGTNVHMVP